MSEPPEEPTRSPEQLLLAAVDELPGEDRTVVLAWLLGRLGNPAADVRLLQSVLPSGQLAAHARERASALVFGQSQASLSEDQRVVPVRFSASQHATLQAWCQEHGFSMATVIRGLVARFLEEHAAQAPDPRRPGQPRQPHQSAEASDPGPDGS
jgi:hypothetical protein